jgi:hypothetical protein
VRFCAGFQNKKGHRENPMRKSNFAARMQGPMLCCLSPRIVVKSGIIQRKEHP